MSQAGRVPVLAFWRTEPLPVAIRNLCAANVNDIAQGRDNALTAAGVPCISGNTYALVVYAVDTNPGATWAGRARLVRYKLSQFTDSATDEGDQSTGYANPLRSAEYTFQQWPYRLEGSAAVNRQTVADDVSDTRPLGTPTAAENPIQTLVDFVDSRGAVIVDANGVVTSGVTLSCDEFVANDQTGNPDPSTIAGALSPPIANNPNNVYGFYACVRGGGVGNSNISGVNQDVVLTIVGNVAGKGGFPKAEAADEETRVYRLSPLQTRVLVRGVVRKQG
uniref:Uncharacterized protein n=1 Tax=Oscillatoriales cyanobacterium SpSt-402 TaxID=2282168 RepID=A0A832H3Z8_9CYAN